MIKHMLFSLLFVSTLLGYSENTAYEYIVVGSGTAGGTLAVELAKKGYKTLLIEAGSVVKNQNISIPSFHPRATEDEKISLDFYVQHYKNGEKTLYPRSSGIGGCSLHNAMISIYPNKRDFDKMVAITKDESWSEKNMRKYYNGITQSFYSLTDVIFKKRDVKKWFPISYERFFRALTLDLRLLQVIQYFFPVKYVDLNARYENDRLGVDIGGDAFIPMNVDTDMTRGHYTDHILEAQNAYALEIWTDTLVTKILLSEDLEPIAKGVEYVQGKSLYKASPLSNKNAIYEEMERKNVYASKGIIISGGVFNTPQLLMLSGIGDKKALSRFNIKTIVDLPGVGKNMQDRYEIPVIIKYNRFFDSLVSCRFKSEITDSCYFKYVNYKTGVYIGNGVISASFVKSDNKLQEPDVSILNFFGSFTGFRKGYSEELSNSLNTFTQVILKARTKNKQGTVELSSDSPLDPPNINFNYFSEGGEEDLRVLINQIKKQREFINSSPLEHTEIKPGKEIVTDEQIKKYIMEESWGHHACCTSKLGNKSDRSSVVNEEFEVHGVKNLRVVDASIFPEIPGFYPALYIHLVAMKAADTIAK